MNQRPNSSLKPPVEPVLDMEDIQGIVVPGFFKPHQTLLYIRIANDPKVIDSLKTLLAKLSKEIATASVTLADRDRFRVAKHKRLAGTKVRASKTVLTAIAFSYPGLLKLTPGAAAIPSEAFRVGLVARSRMLGDPVDTSREGHPSQWKVGPAGNELDAIIVTAGDDRASVRKHANELKKRLRKIGIHVESEDGNIRSDLPGHEHFGFDDGVSQPGIRGRTASGKFITQRHVTSRPECWLYGYPGQDLVWPGEFVFGYPATSPDPLVPGPSAVSHPDWTRNGSFLVFRRLRQDVSLFWRTMRESAKELARNPSFGNIDAEMLASKLVGRWPSGAPISRVPDGDVPSLGADSLANNYILFDSDAKALKLDKGQDKYLQAKADPVGLVCPLAAHIRKVNTRDSSSDMGGRSSSYDRRILRVGVPFGKPLADRYASDDKDHEHGNRGLLFLSIQTSIEEQFEFLQTRWMNDAIRPRAPSGNDMIVGQNAAAKGGVRKCSIFGTNAELESVQTDKQWVIPTGGGYFFVPSLSAIRTVLSK